MTSASARRFELVVWGATGFTGQLVAQYLLRHRNQTPGLRWAIGGRSAQKLERVRAELAAIDSGANSLPTIVADAMGPSSIDALASQTQVIATTVGPFALYGRELVAACARHGTHYCDLTGEAPFVREMIDAHHARAQESGAKIVHCCGFDSIPSDLGVLVLQEQMRAQHGRPCREIRLFAGESRGGVSGGTIASALQLAEDAARDRRLRRLLADPYSLDPDAPRPHPDGPDQLGVKWDPDLRRWTGPFVMAAINTRIVRRSNALLGYSYGRDFRYAEAMSFGPGARGWLMAVGVSAGTVGFFAAASTRLGRSVLRRVLPGPGQGPSQVIRESGFFTMRLIGKGTAENGTAVRLLGMVRGSGDPGYNATAKMLSESALCLARDGQLLPSAGGILTPASAMGKRLVERLHRAGITFSAQAM